MTENKIYNNSKSININFAINSSINNEKENNINILDREKIAQNLKINIDSLKTKSFDLKFVTLNKESIKNYILDKNTAKSKLNLNTNNKVLESSNLNNNILTFSKIIKGFNQNLQDFNLDNLTIKNISENTHQSDIYLEA